jgi:hypothetical protein
MAPRTTATSGSGSDSSSSATGPCERTPAGAQRGPQRLLGELDGGEVGATLGLRDDQAPAHELDRVTGTEDAGLDQPLVLDSLPVPGARVEIGHGHTVAPGRGRGNVRRSIGDRRLASGARQGYSHVSETTSSRTGQEER